MYSLFITFSIYLMFLTLLQGIAADVKGELRRNHVGVVWQAAAAGHITTKFLIGILTERMTVIASTIVRLQIALN